MVRENRDLYVSFDTSIIDGERKSNVPLVISVNECGNSVSCHQRYHATIVVYDRVTGAHKEAIISGDDLKTLIIRIGSNFGFRPNSFTHLPF